MIDLCLRTADEAAMISALPFARTGDQWIDATHDFALAVLGSLEIEPAVFNEQGEEITPSVIDTRFHANLRCKEAIAALVPADIIVTPESPRRRWA